MPQSFVIGQAFWGKIRFPDGAFPAYERPYLVVGVSGEYIKILTVSSVVGKEWKLAIPTNIEIINHDPPFPQRSFVKLDSLQEIHKSDLADVRLSRGGKTLNKEELLKIIEKINS